MPMIAFCGSCGRYVELTAEGACPGGHPRSALRDVRAGSLADAPAVASARIAIPAPEPLADDPSELAGRIIGNAVIYVPAGQAVAGLIFGLLAPLALVDPLLWSAPAGGATDLGPGTPVVLRLIYSVVSLVVTVAGSFLWVRMRRRRH